MKAKHPAWRFVLALKANKLEPRDLGLPISGGCDLWNRTTEKLSELIRLIQNTDDARLESLLHDDENRLLYDAYRVFNLSAYRVQLETFLLANIDYAEITKTLNLCPRVLEVYVNTFFDTSVFKTHIDRHEYVVGIQDTAERDFKAEWPKGLDHLKWRMGFGAGSDATTILTAFLNETYYRYKETRDNKEAMKLCELGTKVANKLMDIKDADKFMEDIHLALRLKKPDFKPFKQ